MARLNPFQINDPQRRLGFFNQADVHQNDIDAWPSAPAGSATLLNSTRPVGYLLWLMILTMVFLLGRMVELQVVKGGLYRAQSEGNRIRTVTTPAPRGAILDRQGIVLADNIPNIIATVTPADLPSAPGERVALYQRLSSTFGLTADEIKKIVEAKQLRSTDPVPLLEHLTYEQATQAMVAVADLPAVRIVSLPDRTYPLAASAAAIIGYTGRVTNQEIKSHPEYDSLNMVGKTGLEITYNQQLTGRDGTRQVERDVHNREQRVISQQEAQPGLTVVSSIDSGLQKILSDHLQSTVNALHSPGGAAIAINPNNGEILALTSAPSYDDNWFVSSGHSQDVTSVLTNSRQPLLNRAISGQYPSGSIIKPIIASAALSERIVTPSTTVLSVGGFKVGNDFFPDWKAGGHGVTNIIKALAESVNTYFYAVGGGYDQIVGLGVDRIVTYLQKFGWGRAAGIDLPSEADGFLPTKDWRTSTRKSPWKLGDTYHLAIGQGDLEVTPLQIIDGISAIANGGTLYEPHIATMIKNSDGQVMQTIKPKKLSTDVVSQSVLNTVRTGLRAGVLSGSSRALQSLPVSSAGKTGTAQFGNQGKTHAWFAAYAPFEHPTIAIVVLVEAGGEGNATALPIAQDALQWYFTAGAGKPGN